MCYHLLLILKWKFIYKRCKFKYFLLFYKLRLPLSFLIHLLELKGLSFFFYSATTVTSPSCTRSSGWTTPTTPTRWRARTAECSTRTSWSRSPTASRKGRSRCSSSGHNRRRCRGPPPAPPLPPPTRGPWHRRPLAAPHPPHFDPSSTRAWPLGRPNRPPMSPSTMHRRWLASQSLSLSSASARRR